MRQRIGRIGHVVCCDTERADHVLGRANSVAVRQQASLGHAGRSGCEHHHSGIGIGGGADDMVVAIGQQAVKADDLEMRESDRRVLGSGGDDQHPQMRQIT